eukprot:scaffold65277_cov26-Cyclotella_meneghiniana.AAC.8
MSLDCCATCGNADTDLKACGSCRSVKYCNVDCQKAHRPAHKKACKKRAAELFDEMLFLMPPPRGECPICFLMLSPHGDECTYMACCGKTICTGCRYSLNREHCPFCNTESPDDDEAFRKNLFERIEKFNDPEAMNMLGGYYKLGISDFPQDHFQKQMKMSSTNVEVSSDVLRQTITFWTLIQSWGRNRSESKESYSSLASGGYDGT